MLESTVFSIKSLWLIELALSHDSAQLAGHEMVRRPRTAEIEFTAFELVGGAVEAVLIFLNGFVFDEVGDIYEHGAGLDAAAADLFFQRME